jgi:hypothetical protein
VVRTLVREGTVAGTHKITWDGRNDAAQEVHPGVYYLRLDCGGTWRTHKVTLVK